MKSGTIVNNNKLQDEYFRVDFFAPEICSKAQSGQFVHVQIASLRDRILRRPFSIHDVNSDGILSVVYKVVGEGTEVLSTLQPGAVCDLMGPLGNGYSVPDDEEVPILIAGGYGSAAMYLLAKNSKQKGILLLGARSSKDLILMDRYEQLGYKVILATNDGSCGHKGFVTDLLDDALAMVKGRKHNIYACGPTPMLMALCNLLTTKLDYKDAEVSLDHLMCCGVGACFACVVKVKDADTFRYARSCSEGPVFKVSEVYLDK